MLLRQLLFISSVIAYGVPCFAEPNEPTEDAASSTANADPIKSRDVNVNVFPYAFYNPEIEFAFGAGGVITFRTSDEKDLRPSKFSLSGYYSTSKQYQIGLSPQVYLLEDRVFVSAKLFIQDKIIFTSDPANPEVDTRAWGMGAEVRMPALLGFRPAETRRKLGLIVEYQNVKVKSDDPLSSDNDRPHTFGLGVSWVWDSREHIFYPTRGHLHRLQFTVFAKDLGSSYDFNRFEIDLRQYIPINPERKRVIAAQFYMDMVGGAPPFYKLPALGGSRIMRGHKSGSLRDRNSIAAQMEFRSHAWRRFGAVAFFGAGDVADEVGDFALGDLAYSYGVGVRFTFDEKEHINFRADFGFGGSTNGIYITVEEAF